METKNLIYFNDHFYDNQNGQRIELQEGAEIVIVAGDKRIVEAQPAGTWPIMIKDTEEKESEVTKDLRVGESKKILKAGSFLYFKIPRGKIKIEFKVELFEDLYMVRMKKRKKPDPILYDCTCVVKENIGGNIKFFEEVFAKSLNELHKNTFVHFFRNKGNPACNAINTFYEKSGKEDLSLKEYRKLFDSKPNLFT
jgi:hypothetical protein